MKKHQLEKIAKKVPNAVVKLDEDEGTYYISVPGYDVVALVMREVDKNGKESFRDKWAVYPVNEEGERDSVYIDIQDDIMLVNWPIEPR